MMNIEFLKTSPDIELFPPIPAKNFIPTWYQNLASTLPDVQQTSYTSNLSIKACMPVQDYILSGYIIRTHMDILVTSTYNEENGETFNFDFKPCEIQPISFHNSKQYPIKNNNHLKKLCKFTGYWGVKTPPGYSCLFYQPEFFHEKRFSVMPGIVDTDQYIDPVHFPFTICDDFCNSSFTIQAGTPIICLLPFKREKWTSTISDHNKNNKTAILMRTIWQNTYRKFMHSKKSFN